MKYVTLLTPVLIAVTALLGDYVVFKSTYSQSIVFRAFSDTFIHGSIGFLSSVSFFTHETNITSSAVLGNVVFCTIISSLIDIDHVFVAKSFLLEDMTNLRQRGIFHCTTFWLLVTVILICYSYITKKLHIYIFTWMLILAYSSHHIRDGNRRGLWLYPFGDTRPISKYLYVILTSLLPYVFALLYNYFKPLMYKHTTVNYMLV